MIVDAHAHVFPGVLLDAMRAGRSPIGASLIEGTDGTDIVSHREGYRYNLPAAFWDPQARLIEMDRLRVDISVFSIAPTLYGYHLEPIQAHIHARVCNDWLIEFVASSDRFVGVGTLPMSDPAAAVGELDRIVELGLRGAQVGPHVQGTSLEDEAFAAVLQRASSLGVPLVIHPAFVGPLPGLEPYFLTNVVGNPHQTTVCATRLIASGALDRFPDLSVLRVHGGGNLPYQIGRVDKGWQARPDTMSCQSAPSEYLSRFHYDTLVYSDIALRHLLKTVGAERVVFGTDSPFDMCGGGYESQMGALALDRSTRTSTSSANALRLFGG